MEGREQKSHQAGQSFTSSFDSNDKLKNMEGREQKSHQAGQSFTSSFDLLGAWSLLYRTPRSSRWKQIHK
jgi:predicted heme/steroid binding protein